MKPAATQPAAAKPAAAEPAAAKPAAARSANTKQSEGSNRMRTLVVSAISQTHTVEELRSHFGRYGVVTHCIIPQDRTTNKSRGFGLVTFKELASTFSALADSEHIINGKRVQVKECGNRKKRAKSKASAR